MKKILSRKNSLELKDRKNQLEKRANEMLNEAEEKEVKMDETQETEFNEIVEEIKAIEEKIAKIEEQNSLNDEDEDVEENDNEDNELKDEERNMNKFSLIKAIRAVANGQQLDERSMEVINKGKEEMRKSGQSFSGQIVLPFEARSFVGADIAGEDKFNLVEPLRANLVLTKAGATMLTGLTNDVTVPVMNKGNNVTWEGEVVKAKNGKGTISDVKLSPKRLCAYIDVSKQFLLQDSFSAEEVLRNDLVRAISDKLEATILGDAAGTATQPEGLFNGATTLTTVDYPSIANLEADLEDANVNNYKFIVDPKTKAKLKTTQKGNGTGFIMENNEIDGVDAFVTSNAKGLLIGDFSDYVIGQWGGVDMTIDPYSVATEGKVRITVNAYFDAKPRRATSFVAKKV